MPTIPANFSGDKFRVKYSLTLNDFWADDDELICPSLPNLTDNDLLDCVLTAEELTENAARIQSIQDLKSQYIAAKARLDEIINSPNPPFTQAGFNLLVNAVRDMAVIEKRILIVARWILS